MREVKDIKIKLETEKKRKKTNKKKTIKAEHKIFYINRKSEHKK